MFTTNFFWIKALALLLYTPIFAVALLHYFEILSKTWKEGTRLKKWIALWGLSFMILLFSGVLV